MAQCKLWLQAFPAPIPSLHLGYMSKILSWPPTLFRHLPKEWWGSRDKKLLAIFCLSSTHRDDDQYTNASCMYAQHIISIYSCCRSLAFKVWQLSTLYSLNQGDAQDSKHFAKADAGNTEILETIVLALETLQFASQERHNSCGPHERKLQHKWPAQNYLHDSSQTSLQNLICGGLLPIPKTLSEAHPVPSAFIYNTRKYDTESFASSELLMNIKGYYSWDAVGFSMSIIENHKTFPSSLRLVWHASTYTNQIS